jgi:Flp pilus assembly protein TadG
MRQAMRNIANNRDKWMENCGASAVEFAIVLPCLLLIVFGVIEFGLLVYNKQILTNACREGARAGVQQASPPGVINQDPNRYTPAQIHAVVNDYCKAYLVTFSNDVPTFPSITGSYVSSCPGGYQPSPPKLRVIVQYQYHFLVLPDIVTKLFGGSLNNTIPLTADTSMTCE